MSVNLASSTHVDWLALASVVGLATLISILTSIATNAATKTGPSLTSERVVPPETPALD